jgi:hypothetical protein
MTNCNLRADYQKLDLTLAATQGCTYLTLGEDTCFMQLLDSISVQSDCLSRSYALLVHM